VTSAREAYEPASFHRSRCIFADVIGPDLFRLGRRLLKLSLQAIPDDSSFKALPSSVRIVLIDALEHPGSTIGHIAERTGFPQSIVSTAVARLRDEGLLETETDPRDRRRTIVSPSAEHRARLRRERSHRPPIDETLRAALVDLHGPDGADHLDEVLAALETLGRHLAPASVPTAGPRA